MDVCLLSDIVVWEFRPCTVRSFLRYTVLIEQHFVMLELSVMHACISFLTVSQQRSVYTHDFAR